ncbi:MAG: hypothetical protein ACTHMD_16575, partial [Flavisolibacter sp.]
GNVHGKQKPGIRKDAQYCTFRSQQPIRFPRITINNIPCLSDQLLTITGKRSVTIGLLPLLL